MDSEDFYAQNTVLIDKILIEHGFNRVCDFMRRTTESDAEDLRKEISEAPDEAPLQRFLAARPHLIPLLDYAHGCRWVRSQPRLGAEYSPDFAIARRDSNGIRWTLIELQSPTARLLLKDGKPDSQLREGIHQVGQWRDWIRNWGENQMANYGYPDLGADFQAIVVIGRSDTRLADTKGRIRNFEQENNIRIQSYDHIARAAWYAVNDCGIEHSTGHWHQYGRSSS